MILGLGCLIDVLIHIERKCEIYAISEQRFVQSKILSSSV